MDFNILTQQTSDPDPYGFHGFGDLRSEDLLKGEIYNPLIEDLESQIGDKILRKDSDVESDVNGNDSPPFDGFSASDTIPGRLKIVELNEGLQVTRERRVGKPRGLDLKGKKN